MDDAPAERINSRRNEFGQPIGPPVEIEVSAPSSEPMVGRWCSVVRLDVADHASALFEAYDDAVDDRAWTYLFQERAASVEEFVDQLAPLEGRGDPMYFVVLDADGPCGMAALQRIDPTHGVLEVGSIILAPRLQRTVASTEAMFLMMQRAFDGGYRRYEWKCDALNAPSRAAAARLGFVYEGDFRQAIVYKGRNRDTSWHAIIDSEWPRLRTEFERWLDPTNFDDAGRQRTQLRH